MKTTVPRKPLLDAVTLARKFPYNSIPILNSIRLDVDKNGKLTTRSTDLDVGIMSTIGGVGDGPPVSIIVDKKKLSETLKSLKEDSVTLEYILGEKKDNRCPECGSIDYNVQKEHPTSEQENGVLTPSIMPDMKTLSYDKTVCTQCGHVGETSEFYVPDIPTELKIGEFFTLTVNPGEVDEFPEFMERPADLENAAVTTAGDLRKVISAATNKDSGFTLNCVNFNADDELMVATDGHRMHMVDAEVTRNFFIPAVPLKKLLAEKKDDEKVVIKMDSSEQSIMAYIIDGDREITIRLLDGSFPDYRSVMNKPESSGTLSVKAGTLAEGMRQALALTTTDYMAVKVSFNGCIDLETEVAGDSYNRASVKIESGGMEPPVSHNFNAQYIVNILSFFKENDELTLTVPQEKTSLFFNDNAGFEALVMPVRA